MSEQQHGDRRRHPRCSKRVAFCWCESEHGTSNHVDNISESGILCQTGAPIPLMTKIQVLLDLPKPFEQRIEVDGVVVRCEADPFKDNCFKVAIFFSGIKDADRDTIRRFVASSEKTEE
ncbi:MAG TPA: PilZ domain-containing protein [Candidatus Hydrogenedentes bacterium]|jgi:hypothetical protein|nr:MAG: PilZ domain protein [Candidatus Hydrogenedentes bacterium ADurb.Bin170]HNZ47318.1 PilZ domain-containing protein [Candidatus Hydrogenedentota bacterium]HOD95257.1 PilZ domain-containing protein [Candidatus Hydrogenedentota bacterium]HOH41512.1 PilZ domain-containing protein [Candidatus Hydrogenedentota bacterium]HOR50436.1 PilZ domain-containing protein [Candidatus Hydrogenedentota bacterium]